MGEATKAWEKIMSSFTDDLWTEVFLRLPIKPLLRFKSVSKSWFSIISSHRFAKSHLARTAENDQLLIVHHNEEHDASFSLFHPDSCDLFKNLKFPYSDGEYPIQTKSKLIGSDCGIVCVFVDLDNWPAAKNKCDIYLWNPETRHSKLIPPFSISDDGSNSSASILGIGFDHVGYDFKVVRVVRGAPTLVAEVYSSNRNVWRKIESNPIRDNYSNCFEFDVCFHGFLLAIEISDSKITTMMAFDLNKEFFICNIKLPVNSFDDGESYYPYRIADFKDSIAATITHLDDGRIQLWTLDNEACLCGGGVDALWTKVLTVDIGMSFDFVGGFFNNVQFAIDDAIDDEDNGVFLYDLNKKVVTYFPEHPKFGICEIFRYTKSLFSLEGFKRIRSVA